MVEWLSLLNIEIQVEFMAEDIFFNLYDISRLQEHRLTIIYFWGQITEYQFF